jgi:hypothetical protein
MRLALVSDMHLAVDLAALIDEAARCGRSRKKMANQAASDENKERKNGHIEI